MQPAKIRVVLPPEPAAPDLASQLPDSIRLDAETARYYQDACDAYEAGDQPEQDVADEYGLSRAAACYWVIDGYTIQDGLTVEHIQIQQADYVERLRAWGRQIQTIIKQIEEQSNETDEN